MKEKKKKLVKDKHNYPHSKAHQVLLLDEHGMSPTAPPSNLGFL